MDNPNLEKTMNTIYKKLKNYNSREIFLEKENLKKFIYSLFDDNKI